MKEMRKDYERVIAMPGEDPGAVARHNATMALLQIKLTAERAYRLAVALAEWLGWEVCPGCEGRPVYDVARGSFNCALCEGRGLVSPEVADSFAGAGSPMAEATEGAGE